MSREPTYTPYVRHAMRFYSRYPDIKEFKSETDKANWFACDRAIKDYSPSWQDLFKFVYGERDTLADNVYKASKKYGVFQDVIWEMMRELERKIAVERGLI